MKTTFKTIIFDFGGVLLRTEDRSAREKWEARLNLSPGQLEAYVFDGPVGRQAQVGQATWEQVWQDTARHFRLSATEATRAQQDFFKGDVIDRDLVNYIRRLKQGYTIGLLSNSWYPDGHTLLLQYGIADAFDFSVTSAETGIIKPRPAIYRAALQKAGADPAQAIFVDDVEENVFAARQLGMEAVYFVDPQAARARLAALTGLD